MRRISLGVVTVLFVLAVIAGACMEPYIAPGPATNAPVSAGPSFTKHNTTLLSDSTSQGMAYVAVLAECTPLTGPGISLFSSGNKMDSIRSGSLQLRDASRVVTCGSLGVRLKSTAVQLI